MYRRSFLPSKKEDFVARLKDNLDCSDLNVDPHLLMDRILLFIMDSIEQSFPLRKVSNKQAKKILNPWMTNEIIQKQLTT